MTIDPKWMTRELWTLIEAAQICAGVNPYPGDSPVAVATQILDADRRELFNELYARSKDARQQSLAITESSRTGAVGNKRVRPSVYVAWVVDTRLPPAMEALIDKAELGKCLGDITPSAPDGQHFATVNEGVRSVDRNQVMAVFPVKSDFDANRTYWDDKLSRPPHWLFDARVSAGKPGHSSRWDLLLVAHALLGRKELSIRQLDAAIHKNCPEILDRWKEGTADYR